MSLTAPADGARYTALTSMLMTATASDQDGVIARVDFFAGTTLLGSDASSPYAFTWTTAPVGSHAIRPMAVDNQGATAFSATRIITVSLNSPPSVSLTSPGNGTILTAPASIGLAAAATDSDGAVTIVEFYAGTTLVGSDATSPHSFTLSSVPAGSYSITAVARDDRGAMTVSGGRDITVVSSGSPGTAIFQPSDLHSTVERYVLEIFPDGSDPAVAGPVATQDLGRPAVVNNECSADVRATIVALAPGTYVATVSAVLGDGIARSAVSPSFTR